MKRVERWIRAERVVDVDSIQRLDDGRTTIALTDYGRMLYDDGWYVIFPEMYGKRLRCHCIPRELL
jgi:hypothetical protein